MQQVEIFHLNGEREPLEVRLNEWLRQPRKVLGMTATDMRLFVRWRPAANHSRYAPVFIKVFPVLGDINPNTRFELFFQQHPGANIIYEAANEAFLFWFWADEI